jgi:DNA-binding LytR/AlgR family response regulator
MLNILVIEDHPDESDYCCNAINETLGNCNIMKAYNGEEAFVLMNQRFIDSFFVDVDLPGINGFQIAQEIRQNANYKLTPIVFITGYRANQLSIHKKYHHYEYIEKPYTLESFKHAVGPLLQELNLQKERFHHLQTRERKKMVLLETKEDLMLVNLDDILYAERQGRGLLLHTKQQTFTDIKMSIDDIIRAANSHSFLRCHKSFAINIKNVKSITNITRRLWHAGFGYRSNLYCQISSTYYDNIYRLIMK